MVSEAEALAALGREIESPLARLRATLELMAGGPSAERDEALVVGLASAQDWLENLVTRLEKVGRVPEEAA